LVNMWVYQPGLPEEHYRPVSERFNQVELRAKEVLSGQPLEKTKVEKWSAHEWVHFLRQITQSATITQVTALDKTHQLTQTGNSEILFQWLSICIHVSYLPAYNRLEEFVANTGRRKFVATLYKQMLTHPTLNERAYIVYEQAKNNYHAVTRDTVVEMLKKN